MEVDKNRFDEVVRQGLAFVLRLALLFGGLGFASVFAVVAEMPTAFGRDIVARSLDDGRGDAPKGVGVIGAFAGAKEKVNPRTPLGEKVGFDGGHYKYRKLAMDYPQWVKHIDSDDAPDANDNRRINFAVDGCWILAVGNSDPRGLDSFKEVSSHPLCFGRGPSI